MEEERVDLVAFCMPMQVVLAYFNTIYEDHPVEKFISEYEYTDQKYSREFIWQWINQINKLKMKGENTEIAELVNAMSELQVFYLHSFHYSVLTTIKSEGLTEKIAGVV